MPELVEIAIAVVEHDGHFLIGQRPEGAPLAGYWEFPGGKIEPGETPREAAARECLEETGLAVTIGDEYPETVHQYEHGQLRLHFFEASPPSLVPPPIERFRWVLRDDLSQYQFPAGNDELLELLKSPLETSKSTQPTAFAPLFLLVAVPIIGLLIALGESRRAGGGLIVAAIGIVLFAISTFSYPSASQPKQFSLRVLLLEFLVLGLTFALYREIGWVALLVWLPLLLMRRL